MIRNHRDTTGRADSDGPTTRVRVRHGVGHLVDRDFRRDWADLADETATRISSRPHYVLCAHHARALGRLTTVTVHRGGRLVALAPFWTFSYGPVRVARVVGDGFGLPVEVLAVDDEAALAVWNALRERRISVYFDEADTDAAAVRALMAEPRWHTSVLAAEAGEMITLPADGSGSRGLRSGHARRRLAAARRRLEEQGHRVELEFVTTASAFETRWPEMTTLSKLATAATGHIDYLAEPLGPFVRDVLRSEYTAGRAGIVGLRVDGRWAAQLITSTTGDRAECWLTHYDPVIAAARPGHLLMQHFTDTATGLGLTDIDLGAGTNEFKAAWSTGVYTPLRAVAVPTTVSSPARTARLVTRLEASSQARKVRLLRGLLSGR